MPCTLLARELARGCLGRRSCSLATARCVSVSAACREKERGWLKKMFVQKVDPRTDAHSNLLSKKETSSLYKLQLHNVKPENLEDYNKISAEALMKLHNDESYPCELVGSWNTWYGEQDQAGRTKPVADDVTLLLLYLRPGARGEPHHSVHLWRYIGGYPTLMDVMNKLRQNKEYLEFRRERSKMLHARKNQLLMEFSFWNEPLPRPGPNIYELRSYRLKPGTMIEWGNNWARAIRFRQENNEAVGGFFSQIGDLYMVHHLWAYKDLQNRDDTRNSAWRKRGWDENVYYTVPLIQQMESRIMIPQPFSPLQ